MLKQKAMHKLCRLKRLVLFGFLSDRLEPHHCGLKRGLAFHVAMQNIKSSYKTSPPETMRAGELREHCS